MTTSGAVPQFEIGRRDDLVEVQLLGVPVAEHQAASEHGDELQREFALLLVQQADAGTPDVPARLLSLIDHLTARFAGYTETTQTQLEEALDRGDRTIDLVFRVPHEVREGAAALDALLDEADEYCRTGGLLTLATPEPALAYRRWYLGEFRRQLSGLPPEPWPGS